MTEATRSTTTDIEAPHKKLELKQAQNLLGRPIREVDPLLTYKDKNFTFCALAKKYEKYHIFRFATAKSLFLFGPLNPLRKHAIWLLTHPLFDVLVLTVIICNCFILAFQYNEEYIQRNGVGTGLMQKVEIGSAVIFEMIFVFFYAIEMIIRVIARGFIFNKHAYLRNGWNILDFICISAGIATIIVDFNRPPQLTNLDVVGDETNILKIVPRVAPYSRFEIIRSIRVFRALKAISILPGLKTFVNSVVGSAFQLFEVMVLTFICLCIFSLFGLQVFNGVLRQKCSLIKGSSAELDSLGNDLGQSIKIDPKDPNVNIKWKSWVSVEDNWKVRTFPFQEYQPCGNSSITRSCGEGYVCLENLGENPDEGYTNYDNYFFSMLSTFQLLTLDYWERLYELLMSTSGPVSLIYFLVVIFFGTYYLLNLLVAVLVMTYEIEFFKETRDLTNSKRLQENRDSSNFLFTNALELDLERLYTVDEMTEEEKEKLRKKIKANERRASQTKSYLFEIKDKKSRSLISISPDTSRKRSSQSRSSISSASSKTRQEKEELLSKQKEERRNRKDHEKLKKDPAIIEATKKEPFRRASLYIQVKMRIARLFLEPLVDNAIFESFILICIIANTILLAAEHYNQPNWLTQTIQMGNHFFTIIFICEVFFKLLAFQEDFFFSRWNIFDAIIVVFSVIDLILDAMNEFDSNNLNVVRGLRLLRILKLAQNWLTMKILLNIIYATLGELWNLILFLGIIIYIFAVVGTAILGHGYTSIAFNSLSPDDLDFPRWHFLSFWYSFMLVFRTICGEWIEPLWDCLIAQTPVSALNKPDGRAKCFVFFIAITIVGNFIVLNLFLALLLNNFNKEEFMTQKKKELERLGKTDTLRNIIKIMVQMKKRRKSSVELTQRSTPPNKFDLKLEKVPQVDERNLSDKERSKISQIKFRNTSRRVIMKSEREKSIIAINKADANLKVRNLRRRRSSSIVHHPQIDNKDHLSTGTGRLLGDRKFERDSSSSSSDDEEDYYERARNKKASIGSGGNEPPKPRIGPCCPKCCYIKCKCINKMRMSIKKKKKVKAFRKKVAKIVSHWIFEWFILLLIFISSISLCFEDKYLDEKKDLKDTLFYMSIVFVSIFLFEMILRLIAHGIWGYLSNPWTLLDFMVIIVSLVSIVIDVKIRNGHSSINNFSALKVLRTLRALRPLRAISKWRGMRIVVNSLLSAIPSFMNVLIVCLLFWLMFAIMGVQLFKGKFQRCIDIQTDKLMSYEVVANKTVCCFGENRDKITWINPHPNFDNVLLGYLSLLQIATFEGWIELMRYAVDSTDIDIQPKKDNSMQYYAFFVIFIVFGSFFTLSLFTGVIIDRFNELKKEYEGNVLELMLSPIQKKYYFAMQNLLHKKPKRIFRRPRNNFFAIFFDISMSKKFEIAIFFFIFFNLVVMAFEHYGMSIYYQDVLYTFNAFFVIIYAIEAFVKIIGLRHYYFTIKWNIFDLALLISAIIDLVISDIQNFPISPQLLRVVRVFKVGRVLRLTKAAKGIRKLIFALVVSLPALFNIGALLCLIMFIYAILGMNMFGRMAKYNSIDEIFNFETFFGSVLVLFRVMTAAGWNDILDAFIQIRNEKGCGKYRKIKCGEKEEPECPNFLISSLYFVSYIIITYLIVINMYVAIILENFSYASKEEEIGIVEDDLDMFYNKWSIYDPDATQFIPFDKLSDFMDSLDPPLGIKKPNIVHIVALNITIYKGNKVHCLDVLQALVRHKLGQLGGSDDEEFEKIQERMENKFRKQFPMRKELEVIGNSRIWKIQHNAATKIQRAWKAHQKRKAAENESVNEEDE